MSADVIRFPVPPSRLALKLEWFAQERSVLLAIWAVYFALRVAVLFIDVAPTSDAEWYNLRALALASGEGYTDGSGHPTAFWPVGWPLVLSLIYRQFGASALVLGLFNLTSSMATGLLTLVLARRLFGNEAAARLALLLLAVYPNAIAYVPLALTEVFYTALLMLAIWILVVRTNAWQLVTAGVLFGLATLVKAQTPVILPLLFAIDWLRMRQVWKRFPRLLGEGLLVMAVTVLTVAPWTARNWFELHAFVPVSTNGGYTLLTGNHDTANGDHSPDAPVVHQLLARTDLGEVTRDKEARRLGLTWIVAHPQRFLALAPRKLARLWLPDGEGEWAYQGGAPGYARLKALYRGVRYANQAYYGLLMAAFALGFFVMLVRRSRNGQRWIGWWLIPYALALYTSALCTVFFGQSRFHYPVMPFVCMVAGWLIVSLWQRASERRQRQVTLH